MKNCVLFLQLILMLEDFPTKWTICKHLLATTVYLQIKPGEKKRAFDNTLKADKVFNSLAQVH